MTDVLRGAVDVVFEAGPDDRVLDGFVLLGPLLVLALALLGRSRLTEALAAGYVLAFLGYVAVVVARTARRERSESD